MTSRSRFWLVSALALSLGLAPVFGAYAQEQKGKTVKVTSQKSRGEGKDMNIKHKSEANDPKVVPAAPVEKGGKKTRDAAVSAVTFDNWTGYKIQIFANGEYVGLVGAYGKLEAYSTSGELTLYARADFTDGSALQWGPATYTMVSGVPFTWKLE
jgi:hypothetical protein